MLLCIKEAEIVIKDYNCGLFKLRCESTEYAFADNIIAHDEYQMLPMFSNRARIRSIIDVGANVGAFSVMCANYWPDATIYAVEPHPESVKLLRHNIQPYPNIVAVEAALGTEDGRVIISDMEMSVANRVNEVWDKLADNRPHLGFEVDGLSMASLIDQYDIRHCDVLKMDCEGAEYAILDQLHDMEWMENVGWVRGEWHNRRDNHRIVASLKKTHVVAIDRNKPHEVGLFIAHRR